MMTKKKAQIFSLDMIVGIISFIIIILIGIWAWDYSNERIYLTETRNDLEIISKNTLNVLLQTPGNPANWTDLQDSEINKTNIISLGLAKSKSLNNKDTEERSRSSGLTKYDYLVLDPEKLKKLNDSASLKYSTYKKILGIAGAGYEFQLEIKEWDTDEFITEYQIGLEPSLNARNIVRSDRFALISNNKAHIILKIWKECTRERC